MSLVPSVEAAAKKGKEKKPILSKQTLPVVNNKGEKTLNGSVLNPKEDEIFVSLHSALVSILRGDLNNVSIVLTSIADPSKRFAVSKDAVNIQDRKINKKNGKYLSVNLYNLKTPSGVTIPPSSLKSDNYKLRITSNKNKLDVSTDSFNYQTPVLIVGMASQKSSGFVVIEDLLGNPLSDDVVSLSTGGSFFTEVRADKVKSLKKQRIALQSNLKNKTANDDDLFAGLVHVISDKDLYAVVPLNNDPDVNNAQNDDSLIVNESTTLTAELAKEDEDLALEVAKKELEDLQTGDDSENDFGDLNCDINQFADRCDITDETSFSSLGDDVKSFILNSECNLPDFVTSFVSNSKGSEVGKGYCKFIGREEDESKLCSSYSKVLNDFKTGKLKQLPCPPSVCPDYQSIQPPQCVAGKEFCDSNSDAENCINKQTRDLFCLKVPEEIFEEECVDDLSVDPSIQPNWVVASNYLGGQYCVPSNPVVISQIKTSSSKVFSSSEDVAEECEYNYCHKQCDGSSADPSGCHFNCDVQFGRYTDCADGNSPFFSIQCCNLLKTKTRITSCFCKSADNFDEVGYVTDSARSVCLKSSTSNSCPQSTPIKCSDGTCAVTRVKCPCPSDTPIKCSDGTCAIAAADCSSLTNSSSSGSNSCPSSKPIKCSDGTCAIAAADCSSLTNSSSSGSNACPQSIPIRCSDGTCAVTQVQCSCPSSSPIRCSDGTCAVAAVYCTSSSTSTTPIAPTALGATVSQSYSGVINLSWVDNSNNEISFSVYRRPSGATTWTLLTDSISSNTTVYTDNTVTVGYTYNYKVIACNASGCSGDSNIVTVTANANATGGNSSTTYCSPGQTSTSSNPCVCASGATVGSAGYCQCTNGQTYAAAGCPASICTNSQVSTTANPCTCAGEATVGSNGACQCPSGAIYSSNGCYMNHDCSPGEASTTLNPCTCAGTAMIGSDSTCQCPSGQNYTVAGGCTGTANQITLNSVTINGNSVTVSYTKNFSSCVTLQTIHHVPVHSSSLFCGNSSVASSITQFDSTLQSNLQVKLCNSDLSVCSSVITTTGTPNCRSGQASTSDNQCSCANGAYFYGGSNYNGGSCTCPNGAAYDQASGCYNFCAPGQSSFYYCTCPTNSTQDSSGYCKCSDGTDAPVAGCP